MKIQRFGFRKLLLISTWVASALVVPLPGVGQPAISGDCGEQSCKALLEQLRERWPKQISKYEAECQDKNTLGLQVFSNEGEPRKVMVACWEKKDANGSRSGESLAVLPFPGEEATFGSSWSCGDRKCEDILSKLRERSPEKIKQYEVECAMESGTLNLLVSQGEGMKEIEIQCYFFSASLIDENGDGVADWDRQTSVDKILGRFQISE